jgi:hypothetical protein
MNKKLQERVDSIKAGMQKLAEFAATASKTAAAPAPVAPQGPSPEEVAKVKDLSLQIGSKLAALELIPTDMIEKNAAAFTGDHIKSLGNTIKILDHLLAERSAAKTASAPSSLGNVVDDSAAKAKPDEIHHRPRC